MSGIAIRIFKRIVATNITIIAFAVAAFSQTSAFTYQGSLLDNGLPANGTYNMTFKVFDALAAGAQQGSTITNTTVTVTNGIFTVQLDFTTSPFAAGANRWLEIAVKKPADATYTTLTPRQQITSNPYTIRTINAGSADSLSAACVTCVTDAQINGMAYSKLSGAPTSLPPSGAAGGDLTGTFPNPIVAANAITSAKIADGTIVDADISAAAAIAGTKISGNIAGSAANVTGTVALANGGTGATTAANARTNLGLGTLATQSPTGTANATTFLRGDNTWGTVGGGTIIFFRRGLVANAGNTSYNVVTADDIIGVDMTAGTNFTINLQPATTAGEILIIKIEKYNNALLPVLTIQPNGTDKIDGNNNMAFGNAGGNRRLYSDGAGNWYGW